MDELTGADPREERLPRWTQAELRRLRETVSGLRQALATLKGEVRESDSRVVAKLWNGYDYTRVGVPATEVLFRLGAVPASRCEIGVRLYSEGDGVEVVVHGQGGMHITPVVANVVRIELAED
jgi:hypothetical protein